MTLLFDVLVQPDVVASVVVAASVLGIVKQILLAALAVLNGILAVLATLAIWKSYLVVGTKVALTVLILIPIAGVLFYFFWGQKKVRNAH